MQHKLINTGDYLLIVDDSEIKEGDYYLFTWGGEQEIQRFKDQESDRENHEYLYRTACKKIIAHLPNNSPILEGVPLLPDLPPLEDEVEKLADEIVGDSIYYEEDRVNLSDGMDLFMIGYNKAKEKYKYTEEDIIKAQIRAYERYADWNEEVAYDAKNQIEKLKQSLQEPKMPVAFLEKGAVNGTWVGEYIY